MSVVRLVERIGLRRVVFQVGPTLVTQMIVRSD